MQITTHLENKKYQDDTLNYNYQTYDCLGYESLAMTSLERVMTLTDTLTKDTFFLTSVSIIRSLLTVVVDVRNTCRITQIIEDVSLFCSEECEGKRMIGRITKNFSTLSKLS